MDDDGEEEQVLSRDKVFKSLWRDPPKSKQGGDDAKTRRAPRRRPEKVPDDEPSINSHEWDMLLGPDGVQAHKEMIQKLREAEGRRRSSGFGRSGATASPKRPSVTVISSTANVTWPFDKDDEVKAKPIDADQTKQRGSLALSMSTSALASTSVPYVPTTIARSMSVSSSGEPLSPAPFIAQRSILEGTQQQTMASSLEPRSPAPFKESKLMLDNGATTTSSLEPRSPAPFKESKLMLDGGATTTSSLEPRSPAPFKDGKTTGGDGSSISQMVTMQDLVPIKISLDLHSDLLQTQPSLNTIRFMTHQESKEEDELVEFERRGSTLRQEFPVSPGDIYLPVEAKRFSFKTLSNLGKEISRIIRVDYGKMIAVDALNRQIPLMDLMPGAGKFECILRAKSSFQLDRYAKNEIKMIKQVESEDLTEASTPRAKRWSRRRRLRKHDESSGQEDEPWRDDDDSPPSSPPSQAVVSPRGLSESEARKYFGTGRRQEYFKRYKAQVSSPFVTSEPSPSSTKAASGPVSSASSARPPSPTKASIETIDHDQLTPWPLLAHMEDVAAPALNLRHLGVTAPFCAALAQALPGLTFLQTLDLTGNRIDMRAAEGVISALKGHQLKELVLDENRIGLKGVEALCAVLQSSTPLEKLSVRHNDLGDGATGQLLGAAVGHKTLRSLAVSGNRVGYNGSVKAGQVLIGLSGSPVGMATVGGRKRSVVKGSPGGQGLWELDLAWNNVRQEGAKAIAQGLKTNVSLKSLDMSWCGVRHEGALELLQAAQQHPSLTELKLERTALDQAAAAALVALLKAKGGKLKVTISEQDIEYGSPERSELELMAKTGGVLTLVPTVPNGSGAEEGV